MSSPESLDELSVEACAVGDVDDDDGAAVVRRAEGVAARGDGDGVDFVVVEGVAVRGTARGRGGVARVRDGRARATAAAAASASADRARGRARATGTARRSHAVTAHPLAQNRRCSRARAYATLVTASPAEKHPASAESRCATSESPRRSNTTAAPSSPAAANVAPSSCGEGAKHRSEPVPLGAVSARSFSIARRAVRRRE